MGLSGTNVLIKLSDPWDLGESFGWEPVPAVIVAARKDEGGGALLMRIDRPFVYKDVRCEYFVARPRYDGTTVDSLTTGGSILCGITRVPVDRLEADDPFDLSWWRGGVAGIGEVEPR